MPGQLQTLPSAIFVDVVDPAVPPETILSEDGRHLTIAVPGDAACTQTQLAVTYVWSQPAMSSHYAGVVVRNVSSTWCALTALPMLRAHAACLLSPLSRAPVPRNSGGDAVSS